MNLSQQRRFATRDPDEPMPDFVARVLPGIPPDQALDQLKSWNLHIFMRRQPQGEILGSDVVFIEPPPANR